MSPLNITPEKMNSGSDRSVPAHVKILGLIFLFGLGVGTGIIFTIMACQLGWIPR